MILFHIDNLTYLFQQYNKDTNLLLVGEMLLSDRPKAPFDSKYYNGGGYYSIFLEGYT